MGSPKSSKSKTLGKGPAFITSNHWIFPQRAYVTLVTKATAGENLA